MLRSTLFGAITLPNRSTTQATAYITHADFALHQMERDHPESPDRLTAIQDRLIAAGLWDLLWHVDAPLASREQVERVHAPYYIDSLLAAAPTAGLVHLDGDTALCPHTMTAAWRAAGAVVHATDLLLDARAANAFCAVRPPGHHAEPDRAMGFCFFNNVAVGVAHALQRGVERVAIADFDVHHGNGTEAVFADDDRVLMVSTYQANCYPYRDNTPPPRNMHNVPLRAGEAGDGFRQAVQQQWLPALAAFKPQMIFVSAGFDGHREDEMAALGLVEADYAWVSERLMAAAVEYGAGRLVSVLEGGYALSALGRSVAEHLRVLIG